MTRTVKVDWRVPSDEWNAFVDHVHTEYGEIKGYVGREAERAMREWIDDDEFAAIEDRINRLIRAAGRRPVDAHEEKTLTYSALTTEDTTRVTCRVDSDVKDMFAEFVNQETDDRLGIGLARALRARRDGGRSARLSEKLDRVVDDAASLLTEVDSGDGLSDSERKTIAICNELGDQFTRSVLEDEIASIAGDSDPTIRRYTDKVTERMDVVEHPHNHELYIPTETAEELAAETDVARPSDPAIDRLEYADLSHDEKVRGIQIELVRHAAKRSNGRYQFKTPQIRGDVFNGDVSTNHARTLLKEAEDAAGFFVKNVGGSKKKALAVKLMDASPALLEEAGVIADDSPPDSDDAGVTEDTADEEFDALMSATPAVGEAVQ